MSRLFFQCDPAQTPFVMKFVNSIRQSVSGLTPGGNRSGHCGWSGYISECKGGCNPGDNTLAQTNCTMKSPRKQNNGNAVGTVRTGVSVSADLGNDDMLPRFLQQPASENPSPRDIPLGACPLASTTTLRSGSRTASAWARGLGRRAGVCCVQSTPSQRHWSPR